MCMQMMMKQWSFNQWNELKTLKLVKRSLNVQNRFISEWHACSHSTLGYLWDAIGITMPNSWNMLSETSAVTLFGFFNFFLLLDLRNGNWSVLTGPLWSRKRLHFRRWSGKKTIFLNSSVVTSGKPAWLRINFRRLMFLIFQETKL